MHGDLDGCHLSCVVSRRLPKTIARGGSGNATTNERVRDSHVYLMRCDSSVSNRTVTPCILNRGRSPLQHKGSLRDNKVIIPPGTLFLSWLRPKRRSAPQTLLLSCCVFILDGQREHEHAATGAGRQEHTSSCRPRRLDQEPRPTCQDGRTKVSLLDPCTPRQLVVSLSGLRTVPITVPHTFHAQHSVVKETAVPSPATDGMLGPLGLWFPVMDSQRSTYSYSVAKLTAIIATL